MASEDAFMVAQAMAANTADMRKVYDAAIQQLSIALAVEQSAYAAAKKLIARFEKQHPDSPLLKTDGRFRTRNGRAKRCTQVFFEHDFRQELLSRGIKDPDSYIAED